MTTANKSPKYFCIGEENGKVIQNLGPEPHQTLIGSFNW